VSVVSAAGGGTRLGTKRDNAPRSSGTKGQQRAIENFQSTHPLSRLYKGIVFLGWARHEKAWRDIPSYVDFIASGWCDLGEEHRSILDEALPGIRKDARAPGAHCYGPASLVTWTSYICSLWAVKPFRERLRAAVRAAIVDGWGDEYLPRVERHGGSYNYDEPPF
jgi:hypothetical protein